ncbi:uncharacterized protein C8Q71DRAFT_704445 [Rhodofomes roseus]|uniref:Zn(2)-C6 fungal-type domain-containing protein n=1 Tax=Rhodofomes roseus TaxID=34475 RepID=A0ABQ8KN57_9APHY|nr:uncharacterized protein C8Q71DRAFT_704445 [Rhodofomes roseus]KAH9839528.1 hypothetical protein C8Q71DRAFT_704445 [Rhodofomes roseus]
MSVEPQARKKRSASDVSAVKQRTTPEDDHRRKRRNRTTQSCLNCHTSKRMCDRKRPCGRCTQLGLTGLCVYEVDDPSRNGDSQDEKCRLQKRVAELESVIRELKNKPHPRWVAGQDTSDRARMQQAATSSPPPLTINTGPYTPRGSTPGGPSRSSPVPESGGTVTRAPTFSHSSPLMSVGPLRVPSSPSAADSSPIATPSPMSVSPLDPHLSCGLGLNSDYDLSSLFACSAEKTGMEESFFSEIWDRLVPPGGSCDSARPGEHCGCLNDPATYNTILELSLRLRKAADILGRSTNHTSGISNCMVNQNIVELDRFTSTALGNINAPPDPFGSGSNQNRATISAPSNTSATYSTFGTRPNPSTSAQGVTVSPPLVQSQSVRTWDYKPDSPYLSSPWEDPFMSWMPQRR